MRYGSACSGMEAAHLAWAPLGWTTAWVSELDPSACALLAHRLPDAQNLGDMTTIPERVRAGEVEATEVFIAGTPCQSFSVAGARRSLDDARGNLALTYCEIVNAIDDVRRNRNEPECIAVWENVPGVLSTRDNAFGCFLGELAGEDCALLPPGDRWPDAGVVVGPRRTLAWRVLDAQYFGLAQRRRRVFVVASARDGFDPFEVLFEREGVRRDSAPSREAREGTTPSTARSVALRGREGGGTAELGEDCGLTLRASAGGGDKPHVLTWPAEIACTLYASFGDKQGLEDQHVNGGGALFVPAERVDVPQRGSDGPAGCGKRHEVTHTLDQAQGLAIAHTLKGEGFDASEDGTGRGTPLIPVDCHGVMPTMLNGANTPAGHMARSGHNKDAYMAVRRLTPRECERLQGAPDDWTLVPNAKGKPMAGGPRYKMLGNSFAVPVIRWIGLQIQRVHTGRSLDQTQPARCEAAHRSTG